MDMPHKKEKDNKKEEEERKKNEEKKVDEAVDETFPASDPPSTSQPGSQE